MGLLDVSRGLLFSLGTAPRLRKIGRRRALREMQGTVLCGVQRRRQYRPCLQDGLSLLPLFFASFSLLIPVRSDPVRS